MSKKSSDPIVVSAEQVWAAAVTADQINHGEYIKHTEKSDTPENTKWANKILMEKALLGEININANSYEIGEQAKLFHEQRLMMLTLRGKNLSDFEIALKKALSQTEFVLGRDNFFIATIASQIKSYKQKQKFQEVTAQSKREFLGEIGTKVSCSIEVVNCIYSQNYHVYFITALTESNHLVFFSNRKNFVPGDKIKITGRIKAHKEDGAQRSTQLKLVRVIDK